MNNPTTDFEEWLDSLGLNNVADEVHFHLPDRTIDVPIIQEETPPAPEIQSVS